MRFRRDRSRSLGDILQRFRAQKDMGPHIFPSEVDIYIVNNAFGRSVMHRRMDRIFAGD